MNNGNAAQSKWSQEFHAARASNLLPCPVEGGCGGDCMAIHPRGIVVEASGGWHPVPLGDGWYPQVVESYV
jgi:hypothetical protein